MKKRIRLPLIMLVLVSLLASAPAQMRSVSVIDWDKAGDETVRLLADYLRIDTTNPPGNEMRAVRFMAELLEREGIEHTIFESRPGRGNLYARLKGSAAKRPLILLNHTDVVPAEARFWTANPFGGEIRGGYLYGRGAIDMKSLGAVQLMAVLLLKRQRVALDRDVIFLATADEEAGGEEGAGWFVRNHPEVIRDAEFLLTEGSSNQTAGDRITYYGIGVTEKTPCWLRLTATGNPGHGSVPQRDSAPSRLLRALARLEDYQTELKVVPAVSRYFRGMADLQTDHELKRAFRDIGAALQDSKLRELVISNAQNAALLRNTIQPTVVKIGSKTNVIAPIATAEIDCRLLPGERPEEFVATVRGVIADPTIQVETLLAFPATESPIDTELYRAITEARFVEDPSARVVPTVLTGFTDSHFFRDLGIVCYGISPFRIPAVDSGGVHGNDERISIDSLKDGTRLLYDVVEALCAQDSEAFGRRSVKPAR
jgi:acetylornithine deacetylase/succinyl-diaminopimelate desuccinylase-like protein